MLDPVFDRLGALLLTDTGMLSPVWHMLYNVPVFPLTDFNNTIVLGSLVGWTVLALPIFVGARAGVSAYRAHLYERLRQSKFVRAVQTSKLYSLYRMVRPE